MKNTRQGRRSYCRIAALVAALTAAILLAMPVAAATVTASDVMIRNSAEEKDGNIIGSLNEGDTVTVKSKATDSAGTEWYLVELPNGNSGYVKAQWIDNGGQDVQAEETAAQEPQEPAQQEETAEAQDNEAAEEEESSESDSPAAVSASGGGVSADTSEDLAGGQDTPDVDDGQTYNPYTDPNAQYSINFVTENDGTGSWYIYNYDTDKRIRIDDLDKLSDYQTQAQKNASSAGLWRTIACILLLLLVAILIFLYVVLRRNTSGGYTRPDRRAERRRRRAAEEEEEEEEEDDESYSWEEEEEEDEEASPSASADSGDDEEALPSDDEEDEGDYEEDEDEDEDDESSSAGAFKGAGLFSGLAGTARKSRLFDRVDSDEDDADYDEEDEDDYEEDEDDEEDDAPRSGGFFGMIKKFFSADDLDDDFDDDDEEDEDDEEEPDEDEDEFDEEEEEEELPPVRKSRRQTARTSAKPASRSTSKSAPAPAQRRRRPARNIEFDEATDYPEDEELLSFAKSFKEDKEDLAKAVKEAVDTEKRQDAAPSGAKAGKAASKRPEPDEYLDDDEDFYADDDDDMEYSFLSSSRKR